MTKDEALKLALEALEAGDWYIGQLELLVYASDDDGTHENRAKVQAAITAIKEALAQPEQEAMRGWVKDDGEWHEAQLLGGKVTYGKPIGILTKMEGDETMKLYPFDPPMPVQDWKTPLKEDAPLVKWAKEQTPPLPVQLEERYFCQRCGKRTADLTTIHTCTPPRENA
jgi:hypothetical protein